MRSFNSQLDPRLVAQSHELSKLTTLLRSTLPPESYGHYHVAKIHDKTLILVTDSPAWTTRLRLLGSEILQTIQHHTEHKLHHIRVVTRRGPSVDHPKAAVIKRTLSPKSSRTIAETASYINDEKLSQALLKMSRHTPKNPGKKR